MRPQAPVWGNPIGALRALLVGLVLLLPATAGAEDASPAGLVAALRGGGFVVHLRHADTTGQPLDRTFDLADRAGQRNLSDRGLVQAERIGEAFRRLGIPVGEVRTSPVFRARDTAERAFGADRVVVDMDLIADDYAPDRYPALAETLRRRLAVRPASGNTVLVGHIVPLSMALGRPLTARTYPEGSAAVFEPRGEDGFRLLGILPAGWETE